MLFRKKKLIDHDPKTLSLELLSTLQGSLIAKLILVNTELASRWRSIAQSADLPDSGGARKTLVDGAERVETLNRVLNAALAQCLKPSRPASIV
jgi:hypothetical protein